MRILGILALAHLLIGILVWVKSRTPTESASSAHQEPPSVQVSAQPPVTTSSPARVDVPPSAIEQPRPVARKDPMSRWTSFADGNTWVSASEDEKRALVRRLAAASRHGNSENYFYDALEEFYSDPSLRRQKLSMMCDIIDAGGSALPADMRSY